LTNLIYSNRSTSGREGKTNMLHMKMLENAELDLMSTVKSAAKDILNYCRGMSIRQTINPYENSYDKKFKKMDSWEEVYENIDASTLSKYDGIYCFGGMFKPQSGFVLGGNRSGVFPKDSGQLKFESTGIELVHFLAILKANREYGIPVHEFCLDPDPFTMDMVHDDYKPTGPHYCYHGYDVDKLNRLDSAQHFYSQRKLYLVGGNRKPFDFTFGYTILNNPYRESIKPEIEALAAEFDKSKLFVWDKNSGVDTYIDRDQYLSMLDQSRFTYIIPAYNQNYFSIYRLIEALAKNCLPLIHPDCKIDDVEKSFDVNLHHIITTERISEVDRKALLAYYRSKILKTDRGFINE